MRGPSNLQRAFERCLKRPGLGVWLAGCAVLLSSSALFMGFHWDDYVGRYIYSEREGAKQLFELYAGGYGLANGNPADTHWQIEQGWAPWWTYDRLLLRLFRPFGIATHWLDFQLWPNSPLLMHLHSLLWLALLVLAATRMYQRALGTTVGGVAALLFALDHTHGFDAGYICNRHLLITALPCVLCLDRHLCAHATGSRASQLLAYALYSVALTSGESAIALLGYLVGHALLVDRSALITRTLRVAPYFFVTLVWRALYSRAGYGASGSGLYIDPGRDPVAYLLALSARAPVLLLGQFLGPPAEMYALWPTDRARGMLLLAWLFVIALLAALWPLRRNGMAWCWLLGGLFAIVPAASTYPHNRQLLFTSFGAMGLLAELWDVHTRLRGTALVGISGISGPGISGPGISGPGVSWLSGLSRRMTGALLFTRAIVSPLAMPITTCGIAVTAPLARAAASIGDDLADCDVVILNAPDYFAVKLIQLQRRLADRPRPRRLRALAFGPEHITVRRTTANILELDYAEGILSTSLMELYRDRRIPMARNERIDLEGLRIEILELTDDGRARTVSFRFDEPLTHPRFRFYAWGNGRFVRFAPPALGQSAVLVPARLELGI